MSRNQTKTSALSHLNVTAPQAVDAMTATLDRSHDGYLTNEAPVESRMDGPHRQTRESYN